MKYLFLCMAMFVFGSVAHSQALRVVGYEGELIFVDISIPAITVRGATQRECEENFESARAGRELYYGIRSGTQECVPIFVYRSPTAPSFSLNPAVTILPEIPWPPVCLSCPLFDNLELVKQLYPDHNQVVMGYVKSFGVDQYNEELNALNQRYSKQLEGFERKMMALDDYLEDKSQ
ncbi:MAG: hypothetical protein DWP95_09755 [Proteobacteria bacterium]|nr:MAG: hypothetical protein DWP95_09755 [Pseudomonadota bacterium]